MTTKGSTVLKRNSTTGKFLVDVPRNVREQTGLKEGDSLIITTTQDGRIIMRPKSGSLRDLRGVSATRIKANDQAIRNALNGKSVSVSDAKNRPATIEVQAVSVKKR
jgi:AbrB family looped-hinge helix DNA binding protein